MTDLRIQATVSADGRAASAELKRLAGDVGRTKQEMVEAQSASKAAAAALKEHTRAAAADAIEQQRLRDALIAARAAEAEATRGHALAAAALNRAGGAAQSLGASAGQARASMANLGQQVGDVAQGIALGVPAFTLLAQQGGQVAFAMSGMGGRLGQVATFLSGPWGAAVLGGAIVLGSLWNASERAAEADQKQLTAKEQLAKAIEDFRKQADAAALSQDEQARQSILQAQADLKAANDKRELIRAMIDQAKAELEIRRIQATAPGQRGETAALGLDVASTRLRSLDIAAAANEAAISDNRIKIQQGLFTLEAQRAKARDAVAKATLAASAAESRLAREVQAGTKTAAEARVELDRYLAAIDRAREAKGAAGRASKEQAQAVKALDRENERLAETYAPLVAALNDYRKAVDDIAKAEARGILSASQAADARVAAEARARQARLAALGGTAAGPIQLAGAGDLGDTLSARVFAGDFAREMERVLGPEGLGRQLGIASGREFSRTAVEFSQVIGNGLAGGFARALQRSTAFAALIERLSPGQGSIVQGEFEKTIREAFRPVISELRKLFGGDGELSRALGELAGGAAVGAATADIVNALGLSKNKNNARIGGQIGGAIGQAVGGPVGALVGSIIGSIGGGLIRPKNPFADARITTNAAGANASIFNQRGDGSAAQGLSIAGAFTGQLEQIASALGGQIRAGLNLGAIGFSGDQFYFNPTGGDFKAAGNQRFGTAEEAVAAAVANALSTGAITASPRVQAVLQRYAGNVNQAIAEALKVRDLEALLEAQGNPFAAAFREFETQARQRLDVAREYGFDIIEIEKLNADQRAALIRDTLTRATGQARQLLDEFRFGDRAGGSVRDRLTSLGSERDRLAGLVRGGDGSQLDALADVIRQIDDLQRETFGATGEAANGRAASAALLQELIDATEARVRAAAEEAQRAAAQQISTLQSMDGTLEDIHSLGREQVGILGSILDAMRQRAGAGGYDFALAATVQRQ